MVTALQTLIKVNFYIIPDLCHCGCGTILYHRGQIYVKGHHPHKKNILISAETKKKISNSLKGRIAWNKGKITPETIRLKNSVAHRGKFCGEKSSRWKGGTSYLPYCSKFNFQKREEIREKYGRKCFLCNKSESTEKSRLQVHHIDYDKEQGCNGKTFELVPLCRSCHGKTNGKREEYRVMIISKLSVILSPSVSISFIYS